MSKLTNLLSHLQGIKVVCTGDIMLDRFIFGTVRRISPEAPVPILHVDKETTSLGGVGNVVSNLVALGTQTTCVAVVGDDEAGREIIGSLKSLEACNQSILIESGRQSTVKIRCIGSNQQLIRIDRESTVAIDSATANNLVVATVKSLQDADVLVISDYRKGALSDSTVSALIQRACALGKPIIVDPKGTDYQRYRGATIVTPNIQELADATSMHVDSDSEVEAAAWFLVEEYDFDAVLVTRSERGMSLVTRNREIHHFPTKAHEVYDVSGAGDTVVATLAASIAGGLGLVDSIQIANMAAGLAVSKLGTATVTIDEIKIALRERDTSWSQQKIVSSEDASLVVDKWRKAGFKIGFTNGCFDLLHPGHVKLLAEARCQCDRLVVGLNSDTSVRKLKGAQRPIQSEIARATVLASLSDIDAIVVFEEETPILLIERIKPDVLVKGADHTLDRVVGAELVMSHGGRVHLVDLEHGHSTTELLVRSQKGLASDFAPSGKVADNLARKS